MTARDVGHGDPDGLRLTAEEREIADLLWLHAHGAPPLAEDPVARMLGLVPDPGAAAAEGGKAAREQCIYCGRMDYQRGFGCHACGMEAPADEAAS